MTDESHNLRSPATRPGGQAQPIEDGTPTIRTTPVDRDSLPDQASQYIAPQPAPRVSEHKTIDMVPVRLAPDVDPRNARTQRLSPVPVPRTNPRLWWGAAGGILVLIAVFAGTSRVVGRSSGSPSGSASPAQLQPLTPVLPAALPPSLIESVPAAAVVRGPELPAAPDASAREGRPPASAAETADVPARARAPLKAATGAPPAKAPRSGREIWLE